MAIPGPELGSTWLCRPQTAGAGRSYLGSALGHLGLIVLLAASQGPQIRQAILARHPAVASLVAPAPARPALKPAIPLKVGPVSAARLDPRMFPQNPPSLPVLPPMPAQAPTAAKLLVEPALSPTPPPLQETVKTGVFASAASAGFAAAEAKAPVGSGKVVVAAGFGTATAAAKPVETRTVAASSFGDAVPAGARRPAAAVVANGGFPEATAARSTREGPVAVSSGGFGEARTASPAEPRGTIQLAGFTEVVSGGAPKPARAAAEEPLSAVAILQKPRPAYTEEARNLKVEGEVWLEVLFSASGKTQILRVVKRLGHGLDESAIQSAAAIRFRPAQRNGAPVDSIAIARISFQLAY